MKLAAKHKHSSRILQDAIINNDLKKYQDDPIVLKKAARAIEVLRKVKNLSSIL